MQETQGSEMCLNISVQEAVICRICLFSYKTDETTNIFTKWQPPWSEPSDNETVPTVADILADICKTEFQDNDACPKDICSSCFHQFWKACLLIHRVRLSDRILRKHGKMLCSEKKEDEIFEDAPMTITSALQLSKTQYDNLELAETGEKIEQSQTDVKELLTEDTQGETVENSSDLLQEIPTPDTTFDNENHDSETLDWKKEEEMCKYLERYSSEWIGSKDVYTSTDDFDEYLGVKIEQDEDGSDRYDGRLMNGFHSEEMFDADQIKLESDGSNRFQNSMDREGSPYMETEWLEDFKTELSDSELTENVPQECMLCSKQFHTISGLKAHVISTHSYRTVFRMSVDSLTVEVNDRHSRYKPDKWCKYCKIAVNNLARHLHEVKHAIKKCSWCEASFDNDRLLHVHSQKCTSRRRNINGQKIMNKIETSQENVRVACIGTVANSTLESRAEYKCSHCSESFVSGEYLNIHIQAYHSPSRSREDGTDDLEGIRMEISQGAAT